MLNLILILDLDKCTKKKSEVKIAKKIIRIAFFRAIYINFFLKKYTRLQSLLKHSKELHHEK
jgi:hypothetical protein